MNALAVALAALALGLVAQEAQGATPPLVRWEQQLVFYAFVVVILVVPLIMARGPSERIKAAADRTSQVAPPESRFTSNRERRLWTWALIVVAAIYCTLSPAQELAAALRERNLLRLVSGTFLLLVAFVIVAFWVKRRPGRREIGAGIGVMAVYLTTLVRMPVPEARSHLFEYGLLAMLIYHALVERRRNGRRVPVPVLLAVVATALLGWMDELVQALLPNRVYDIVDVGLNAAFGTMAIVATLVVEWARNLDIVKELGHRSDS